MAVEVKTGPGYKSNVKSNLKKGSNSLNLVMWLLLVLLVQKFQFFLFPNTLSALSVFL